MFKRKYIYYLVSVFFVVGLCWGIQNSDSFVPALSEKFQDKQKICVSLPKDLSTENLKTELLKVSGALDFKPYESDQELRHILIEQNCELVVFPSRMLPFFPRDRLVQWTSKDFDFSRVSPDFLGLSFDRLNQFFVPVAFWIEASRVAKSPSNGADETQSVNLYLTASFNNNPYLNEVRSAVTKLLSPEAQQIIGSDGKLGSILKDSEVNVPVKSSAVRQIKPSELHFVDQ